MLTITGGREERKEIGLGNKNQDHLLRGNKQFKKKGEEQSSVNFQLQLYVQQFPEKCINSNSLVFPSLKPGPPERLV